MKYGSLVFEKKDFVMIQRYHHLGHYIEDYAHKDALDNLEDNMSNALVYDLEDIPDDIIRLYSYVTARCESGWSETFQLVLPYEHDIENEKVSVRSTLGASVIGLSEGDSLKYGLPGDIMTLKIEKVVQSRHSAIADIPEEVFKDALPLHYKDNLTLNI